MADAKEKDVAAMDYRPCRYGRSRLLFRGPQADLDAPYLALVGGSETYGRFVSRRFGDLLTEHVGLQTLNLGAMQAGLTLIADDPVILDLASRAQLCVFQVLGAQNMSNRSFRRGCTE